MGVVISEASSLGTELKKWNTPRNQFVVIDGETTNVRGMGAVGFEQYPRMIYKAQRTAGGQWRCLLPMPTPLEFANGATISEMQARLDFATTMVEAFNKSCWMIVHTEHEYERERANGWSDNPKEAQDRHEALEQDIAAAAAEAAFHAKHMGEKAQAEFALAGAQTEQHVVDVKPKRKYTRRSKAASVPVTGTGEVTVTE